MTPLKLKVPFETSARARKFLNFWKFARPAGRKRGVSGFRGLGVQGLGGLGVCGLGFRVQDSGFRCSMYFGPKWSSYRYCEFKVHIHVGTSALVLVLIGLS